MTYTSVFDIFKIGIGPSSSHTMGPMIAANRFAAELAEKEVVCNPKFRITLLGSLAYTGRGHASDKAAVWGLCGLSPESFDHAAAEKVWRDISDSGRGVHPAVGPFEIDLRSGVVFDTIVKPRWHPNTLTFEAFREDGSLALSRSYVSIGGGSVVAEEDGPDFRDDGASGERNDVPFAFQNGKQLLDICAASGISISEVMLENETSLRGNRDIAEGLDLICEEMLSSISRGALQTGVLPGGLQVRSRAQALFRALEVNPSAPFHAQDRLLAYALAVNEENARGARVVTAPTNGAAGVVPAVLRYWLDEAPSDQHPLRRSYLLTAAAIGAIIKRNASVSGADLGCQAEVGSAAAMAAAGYAAVCGGTPRQVENAAEIALEHHLGLACDPVMGLVQVPCIERNGLGAIKAVAAARLALSGDGDHVVPLDACIEAMRNIGNDMHERYKETSQGGLALFVTGC
ncbi:L-serine ammonia-lyase [Stappia sp.]|uniref:L-serine ammonia-lyase n=1 Tax=Stappia sp. TaxID=1870903 RepID=UPI003D0F47E2